MPARMPNSGNEVESDATGPLLSGGIPEWVSSNPSIMAGIRAGLADLADGRVRPWEEVRKELGLGSPESSHVHDEVPDDERSAITAYYDAFNGQEIRFCECGQHAIKYAGGWKWYSGVADTPKPAGEGGDHKYGCLTCVSQHPPSEMLKCTDGHCCDSCGMCLRHSCDSYNGHDKTCPWALPTDRYLTAAEIRTRRASSRGPQR